MMSSSLTNDIDHRQSPPVLTVDVPTRHLVRSVDTNTSSSTPPPPNNYYNTVNGTSNNMIVEPPIVLPYVGGGGQQQQQHHHYMTYTNSNTGGAAAANAAFVTTAIPSSSHNNPADHRTQYSNSTRSTGSGGGVNNTMLQLAFPTAEYALQQQQMLEQQQQYAIQYEQQQQQQKQWQQQYIQQQSQQQQVPIVPPLPLQQAQPPMLHNPESFPWTLGSTDGAYAMSLLLQQQQEQSIQQQQPVGAVSSGVMEVALVNELNAKLYLQQQQQQLLLMQQQQQGGVAPPVTTGATIAALTGEAADNGDDDNNPMSPLHDENDGGGGDLVAALGMNSRQQQQQQDLVRKPMLGPEGLQVRTSEYYSDVKSNSLLLSSQNTVEEAMELLQSKKSLYQVRLFRQPSSAVEACLAAACEVMNFDIAEMWLRTGPKTHQLTNSHLRPTALEDSVRKDLVDVYYGETSSERTHRLSPALCKRAKEAADVVWVTAHNPASAEALRCSISNVRTAVAVPVCHQASNTNMTILFFSIRRILVRPTSVEFLVHMSLGAGVASVNSLADEGATERDAIDKSSGRGGTYMNGLTSRSEHVVVSNRSSTSIQQQLPFDLVSVTGARLDLQWRQLTNVEYLTDGGNSWIHTAVYQGKPVVVKTLKPECQDVAVAINEIEGELSIHSRLNHPNIVSLLGAGLTSKGVRFFVLERLDGGTLTQMLGYETRIRDRRRRFWRRKLFSFIDVLRIARSIAEAMTYCHERAIPGNVILHRDLKPDNIGFTLDGTVKILDFGLAKILEHSSVESDEVYTMSGETGSLRYMAPEVADGLPYNFTADVYSFGIILWELNASKKPYEGLNRELFYERIVHGGERPPLGRKWPSELTSLMSECWDADMHNRPKFRDVVSRLDALLLKEKGGASKSSHNPLASNVAGSPGDVKESKTKKFLPKLTGMIDRHSTWF